jgi:hypothetical protein
MRFENGSEHRHERDVALVSSFDLPAKFTFVAHTDSSRFQVQIFRKQEVADFTRPQSGQHQRQKNRKLPIITRREERSLLFFG